MHKALRAHLALEFGIGMRGRAIEVVPVGQLGVAATCEGAPGK